MLGLAKGIGLILRKIVKVEGFSLLHDRPGNDQEFCGQLDFSFGVDPFFLFPSRQLLDIIAFEFLIQGGGNMGRLV